MASDKPPAVPPLVQAIRTGPQKSSRWLILCLVLLVLLGVSASGALGLVVGAAFLGWGIFAYKHSRRTAVEFALGRTRSARWAAVLTAIAGALFAILGLGGMWAKHEEASRKEAAAIAEQKQAAREDEQRKQVQESLLAAAPAKAAAWRATLGKLSSDLANAKTNDELDQKFGAIVALRDEAKAWLGQLPQKPADAAATESEIESKAKQLQPMIDFIHGVTAFEGAFRDAKALVEKREWLAADRALDATSQHLVALETADPSFRKLVDGGFDPGRKKAEVSAAKAGIAGAVVSARKQQAAAEAVKAKEETYLALCGEAPRVSSWDGAPVGLESAIKKIANDPDSIDVSDCTTPVLSKDNCWVSTCNVRGKNGFGALILLRQTWSYSKALGFQQVGK